LTFSRKIQTYKGHPDVFRENVNVKKHVLYITAAKYKPAAGRLAKVRGKLLNGTPVKTEQEGKKW
jgi:hypothetical protein